MLASFHILTCFELLNEWHGAELDIKEFHMLYTLRKNVDPSYFFQSRPIVTWSAYIIELPRHDKDLVQRCSSC